jgi:hypothetical protein
MISNGSSVRATRRQRISNRSPDRRHLQKQLCLQEFLVTLPLSATDATHSPDLYATCAHAHVRESQSSKPVACVAAVAVTSAKVIIAEAQHYRARGQFVPVAPALNTCMPERRMSAEDRAKLSAGRNFRSGIDGSGDARSNSKAICGCTRSGSRPSAGACTEHRQTDAEERNEGEGP